MSELDKERRETFLEDVKDTQIIITCTDKLELKNENKKIFFVENRKCNRTKNIKNTWFFYKNNNIMYMLKKQKEENNG